MPPLHDPAFRESVRLRVQALKPDAERQWGKMRVDQMLWHVNEGLEVALGHKAALPRKAPFPPVIMRFLVLNVPWPKGAPTMPELVATGDWNFEAERARCLQLIDEFAATDPTSAWPTHPMLGKVTGRDISRLQGKHLDHHLKQFGA